MKMKVQRFEKRITKLNQCLKYDISMTDSQLNALQNVNAILIRQENNIGDLGLGFSDPLMYKYMIYEYDLKSNTQQAKLFSCKEIDPPYTNYWAGNRRQINIEVTEPFSSRKLLRFSKPVQLSFLSVNRPYLQMEYLDEDQNGEFLGEIRSPFSWTSFNYHILDNEYQVEYSVVTHMHFQMMLSRLRLKQFMQCDSFIYEKEDRDKQVGKISSLFYYHQRKQQTIADLFTIAFPHNASVEQKCRILGMAILNDFWAYGGIPKLQMAYTYA